MDSGPKSNRIWADAIKQAVHEYHQAKGKDGKVKKQRYLRVLASRLVEAGVSGDIGAIKEIGDRLDGKPTQAIDANVEGEIRVRLIDQGGA